MTRQAIIHEVAKDLCSTTIARHLAAVAPRVEAATNALQIFGQVAFVAADLMSQHHASLATLSGRIAAAARLRRQMIQKGRGRRGWRNA